MISRHGTLGAGVVTTLSLANNNSDWVVVHIRKGATGPIYVTVDGTDPTVGGNDTLIVQSVGDHGRAFQIPTQNTVTVKLISATADAYSVEVF